MCVDSYRKDRKSSLITTMHLRFVGYYYFSFGVRPDEFRIKNKSLILRMQNNGISINTIRLTKTTRKKSLNKVWVNSFSAKNTTRVRFTVMQTPLQMSVRPQ